jgi:phosphogluconate dehydratase
LGTLDNLADTTGREISTPNTEAPQQKWGRDMFKNMPSCLTSADLGASFIV